MSAPIRPSANPGDGAGDYALEVRPHDIDHMGHVNNAVYLTWVERAVVQHWERFADDEAVRRYLWVALKHEITYRRPAFLGDRLTARVIVEGAAGARAHFHTLIRRGEVLIAEARSSWCAVDATTRRPRRLAPAIVALFVPAA